MWYVPLLKYFYTLESIHILSHDPQLIQSLQVSLRNICGVSRKRLLDLLPRLHGLLEPFQRDRFRDRLHTVTRLRTTGTGLEVVEADEMGEARGYGYLDRET